MAGRNRVIWSEGMYLRPQHFQQHDRYFEQYVDGRCHYLRAFGWGFYTLKIDQTHLGLGQLALAECKGIFPDGTPFDLPEEELPLPLDIPEDLQNNVVYLALPTRRPGAVEVDFEDNREALTRYRVAECSVSDSNVTAEGKSTAVELGKLQTRFLLESEERKGYVCLGVTRIKERRPDKNIVLDDTYIPPTLNCRGISNLRNYLKELGNLLETRGKTLGARVSDADRGGVADISDFLLLQVINRFKPLIRHLSSFAGLHPESFYGVAIQLAGELATFTGEKTSAEFPDYDHDALSATFAPVMNELRSFFSRVDKPNAVALTVTGPVSGIYGARVPDVNLLDSAVFVLAANAQVSPELIRSRFPAQIKIGPVEDISQLIRAALPGIAIHPLSVAPRQIPFHAGFCYFELDKHGDLWKRMKKSGGFAIQIGGDFPGLALELWAIKSG